MLGTRAMLPVVLVLVWPVDAPLRGSAGQPGAGARAVPVEPVGAILEAFRSHSIVALGERSHFGQEDQAFRLALIRDTRFAATVNDIVVERGSARYQDVADRFVLGEEVPPGELRRVWKDTTSAAEEFETLSEDLFRAIRAVNASLPRERRLRVLLGDPPIDWAQVRTYADLTKWGDIRDAHAADIIRREVLAKGRRALVIYGRAHFVRANHRTNFETNDWLTGLLERDGVTKVFNIWPIAGREDLSRLPLEIASWDAPALALLRGTTLGAVDANQYLPEDPRFAKQGDRFVPIARDAWRGMRMDDQFDALLYLGPTLTAATLSPALCSDKAYIEERLRRMAIVPGRQADIDRLKQYCANRPPA